MLLLTVQVSNATLLLIALIMYGFLGKLAVEPIIISWLGENAPKLELALLWACLTFRHDVICDRPSFDWENFRHNGFESHGLYIAVVILLIGTILLCLSI